jgi:hypothetical protein
MRVSAKFFGAVPGESLFACTRLSPRGYVSPVDDLISDKDNAEHVQ